MKCCGLPLYLLPFSSIGFRSRSHNGSASPVFWMSESYFTGNSQYTLIIWMDIFEGVSSQITTITWCCNTVNTTYIYMHVWWPLSDIQYDLSITSSVVLFLSLSAPTNLHWPISHINIDRTPRHRHSTPIILQFKSFTIHQSVIQQLVLNLCFHTNFTVTHLWDEVILYTRVIHHRVPVRCCADLCMYHSLVRIRVAEWQIDE